MKDPVEWAKGVAEIVKGYVSRAMVALYEKLDALEDRINGIPAGPKGDPGPQGEPGINAYEVAVSLGFQGSVNDWMAQFRGERGDKGDQGKDGTSVTVDQLLPIVKEWFEEFKIYHTPVDGRDGIDGKSVTVEDMRPLIESEQNKWALDFERRAQDVLRAMGEKIPIPKDGKDGVGFDDLDVVHDGERDFKFAFRQGERVKEFQFTVPALIERGVYKPDTQYKKGDGVTYGGSYWIALADTMQKPGEGKDWRLAVKKGRDGRDGDKGDRGPEGPKGKDGGKL